MFKNGLNSSLSEGNQLVLKNIQLRESANWQFKSFFFFNQNPGLLIRILVRNLRQ